MTSFLDDRQIFFNSFQKNFKTHWEDQTIKVVFSQQQNDTCEKQTLKTFKPYTFISLIESLVMNS